MKIQRTSAQSGITRTLDLDLTLDEYASWRGGELIQNAMPRLNADEREFLMTGITAEEWEKLFSTQEV
jgi:7,8-dihydro-6-hydroxymethylpterin-pyrophosphokinase